MYIIFFWGIFSWVIFNFVFRMRWWFLLVIANLIPEIENEEITQTEHGVIIHKTDTKVVVLKDSVLVTFIYDTDEIKFAYNEYIEYLENLTITLGEDDECLNDIIKECKMNRMKIKNWFNHTINTIDRQKRQAGIIGGVVGLFSLGLTQMQIYNVHQTLHELQNNVDKNSGEIKILSKVLEYNSHSLELFRNQQMHTYDILHNVVFQVNETVQDLNEVKRSTFCINLKLSFMNISKMVSRVWKELKDMIDFKFNRNLLSLDIKKEVCEGIKQEKLITFGECLQMELVKETKFKFLDNKMVIIAEIPVQGTEDDFMLHEIVSMPVKINNEFYKIRDIDTKLAVGNRYRTRISGCKKHKKTLFCKASSEFRSIHSNDTCLGNILNNGDVVNNCNMEIIKNMENTFINIKGVYYFSLENTINLELLCVDSLDNAMLTLRGLGKIKIKQNCYAKFKGLLLSGSNHVSLNDSYDISLMHEIKFRQKNFTLLENKNYNISIPTITQFNKSKDLEILDSNQYNKVQSFVNLENILILSIAIVISSIITLSVLAIITRIKKCLSIKNNCNKNVKSNQVPVTIELDHKLRKFPTSLETKIMSDIDKFEKRKKQVIYNDIEINDYEFPKDNY